MKGTRTRRRCGFALLSILLTFLFCMGGCGQQPPEETGETGGIEGSRETSGSTELPSVAATEGQVELRGSYRLEELNCPDPDLCLQELQGQGLSFKKYPFQLTAPGIGLTTGPAAMRPEMWLKCWEKFPNQLMSTGMVMSLT